MNIQLLWFDGCPNHVAARSLLRKVLAVHGMHEFEDIEIDSQDAAERNRFPGSPTIRVDGVDVEPAFVDPGDYPLACRVYPTSQGLRGVPEGAWIERALLSR